MSPKKRLCIDEKLAHAKKRELETPEKIEERDKIAHAKKRALETPEKTEECHIVDKLAHAKKRALETPVGLAQARPTLVE